jgi:subtilase family serine protease
VFSCPHCLFSSKAYAAVHDRILRKIEKTSSFAVRGNVNPLVRADSDRGKVAPLFQMERITMVFKPTEAQQAELDALLKQQQDPTSPGYHRWLTPEEFADRFGVSASDLDRVVDWLHAQGFTIDEIARNRRSVTFTGSASQIETAFRTPIHEYIVDGVTFYENANDPYVPEALGDVVMGFRSLNNFRLKARPQIPREHR